MWTLASSGGAITEIVVIVSLAVAATWLADRLRIPSIVLLLLAGIAAGPLLHLIDPDVLLADTLPPLVSLAVGVILFEGGLSLRLRELKNEGRVVWLLVTLGVAITWLLGAVAAEIFLDIRRPIAVLLGAILVVSGPTVIAPILASVRPNSRIAALLKWESIVIDPIGAMLAVIVFDVILTESGASLVGAAAEIAVFVAVGITAGVAVAVPVGFALRHHLIPERLIPLVGITAALVAFAVADGLAPEAGLLATTVLGLVMANTGLRTEPIIHFAEVLQPLLVGVLFIMLSARLTPAQVDEISVGVLPLIAVLVLVARPLAVAAATWRSRLTFQERAFLAAVAPRGIVAAAVASVFALELEQAGIPGAEVLTPIAFAVIIVTVTVYGFAARPLATRLGLAETQGDGAVVIGAGRVERELARALADVGVDVILVSSNRIDERTARMAGFRTHYGSLVDETLIADLDLSGIGRLVVATADDGLNTLLARRFVHVFGPGATYQIAAERHGPGIRGSIAEIGGRTLFAPELTYARFAELLDAGRSIRATRLTEQFTGRDLLAEIEDDGWILFVKTADELRINADHPQRPMPELVDGATTVLWIADLTMEPGLDEAVATHTDAAASAVS